MIFLDNYSVYHNLDTLSYENQTVNHCVEFVTEDGIHKNTIEGFGGIWKADFKQMRGCNIKICKLHFNEIMYRRRYNDIRDL